MLLNCSTFVGAYNVGLQSVLDYSTFECTGNVPKIGKTVECTSLRGNDYDQDRCKESYIGMKRAVLWLSLIHI